MPGHPNQTPFNDGSINISSPNTSPSHLTAAFCKSNSFVMAALTCIMQELDFQREQGRGHTSAWGVIFLFFLVVAGGEVSRCFL